jgi:hypothetical protein
MTPEELDAAFQTSPLIAELKAIDIEQLDSEAKRQHFVPQLLLRGFARPKGRIHELFQLDVKSGKPIRTDTRAAASRRMLYLVEERDGTRHNRLEGFLARVESHAAPALVRLLEDPSALSDADRATLAYFFAIQTQRTPSAAARMGRMANIIFQTLAGSVFSDRQAFAGRYRQFFADEPEKTDDEIEAFRLDVIESIRAGQTRMSGKGGAAFSTAIGFASQQSMSVMNLSWTVLRRDSAFVTSDRAFAIYDPTPTFPWSAEAILSSPNVQTTIPLTQNACLLLRPFGPRIAVEDIGADDAETINLRTYGWAEQYIFGASQDVVTTVRRQAKARPNGVRRPSVPHHVVIIDPDPGDDQFAEANRRRGWPPRLEYEGVEHDYVVIPHDRPSPELHAEIDAAVEQRARKVFGVGDEEPLEGRIRTDVIHPLDLA